MRALTRLVLLALLALGLAWGVLLALALLRSTGLGIYYTSLFSVLLLGIAYFVLLLALWGVAHITRNLPARKVLLGVLGAVFLLLPIAEELWIAWRFAQACENAGTFIYKKVQVEGFYDETRPADPRPPTEQAKRSMDASGYRFHERPRYGRRSGSSEVVRFEKVGDDWRVTLLDRPTARYHFRYSDAMSGTPWGHKIIRSGSVVIDSESNYEIARYASFGRRPPWFFVWLDTPAFACDAPGRWPLTKGSRLIYPEVLIPVVQR